MEVPSRNEPAKARAPISRNGQTKTFRVCSLSDSQETTSMAITASRYGAADSQPASTMAIDLPALRIDGSHSTKPYTPMLQQKYWAQSRITFGDLNASR